MLKLSLSFNRMQPVANANIIQSAAGRADGTAAGPTQSPLVT